MPSGCRHRHLGGAVIAEVKYQNQRLRELEAEILALQLCCNDVALAMNAQGQLHELWNAYVRLLQKGTAAVSEWQRLSNSHAALH
jgi:hypothetical protein